MDAATTKPGQNAWSKLFEDSEKLNSGRQIREEQNLKYYQTGGDFAIFSLVWSQVWSHP